MLQILLELLIKVAQAEQVLTALLTMEQAVAVVLMWLV
jgi:hypothetical protein